MASIQTFRPGRILLAVAMCALGALGVYCGDYALQWQPVPPGLPGYHLFAYISAALLLGGGVGLFLKSSARAAALLLMGTLAVFWLLPHVLHVAAAMSSLGAWLGGCEVLGVIAGASVLWAAGTAPRIQQIGRILFGLCCVVYGASHFVYADFTAAMIPGWLPQRLELAYFTGACHALAGLAITFNQLARPAALLEAAMMSLFVILLHLPSLWASPPPAWGPTLRSEITPLFWASALAASAWLIYESLLADE